MHTTYQLARAVMRQHNITSAYALSKKLDVNINTGQRWLAKKNTFSEETALKCAQLLSLNPAYVLACNAAEKAKSDEARIYWREIAEGLKD